MMVRPAKRLWENLQNPVWPIGATIFASATSVTIEILDVRIKGTINSARHVVESCNSLSKIERDIFTHQSRSVLEFVSLTSVMFAWTSIAMLLITLSLPRLPALAKAAAVAWVGLSILLASHMDRLMPFFI